MLRPKGVPILGWVYYFSDFAATCTSSKFRFVCPSVCFSVHISQVPALCHSLNTKHIAKKASSDSAADHSLTWMSPRTETHWESPAQVFPHIKTDDTSESIATPSLPWKNGRVKSQTSFVWRTATNWLRTDTLLLGETLCPFIIVTAF